MSDRYLPIADCPARRLRSQLHRPNAAPYISLALCALLLSSTTSYSAPIFFPDSSNSGPLLRPQANTPVRSIEVHKINNLQLAITNGGQFGIGFARSELDPETGQPAPSCEFPAGSNITYLYVGSFWASGVVGRDTLTSVGFDGNSFIYEFWAAPGEEGAIKRRSNMKTTSNYSLQAVSEQDYICTYTDTVTLRALTGQDGFDNRAHLPLGLKVDQRSYAWSYDYASDFVMFDFTITNINHFPLKKIYFGVYVDADVYHESLGGGWTDDICGFLNALPAPEAPGYLDTVRIAWTADNDGDPNTNQSFDFTSGVAATGTAVLRTPNPDLKYSFNWWIANGNAALDFGPRKAGTDEHPFRDFGTGLGSPNGDRNKYYIMSNNENDYDQLEAAVSHTASGWLPPPVGAAGFADGFDARYLLSFGPFDLSPGDTLPITLAYVAGDGFHQNAGAFAHLWNPLSPSQYQKMLNYADLGTNAKWAKWIFDNPCYDTDGNGDSGKVRCYYDNQSGDTICDCYEGDGVPDFRGASAPPAPVVQATPEYGKLRIRWNGEVTEKAVDVFSGQRDFEGYRIYIGEDNRLSDYVLMAAYDLENYNLHVWNPIPRRWELSETPLMMDSLRSLFGPDFDPMLYPSEQKSFLFGDKFYYFSRQDWNASNLSTPHGIHRLYPDANLADSSDTTADGHHRFYEYEYYAENLEPSIPYYVSVTAFDFGSRRIALSSLESSPNVNAVRAYPLPSSDDVEKQGLGVIVFPNPYRIDGGYAAIGYENRDRTKSAERARAIHFANLPNLCTIRIYTVDGDLVDEIEHNYPQGGPVAQEETWNIISRNTQAVVTGVYLYSISSDMGEQLGKLVIIK